MILNSSNDFFQHVVAMIFYNSSENLQQQIKVPTTNFFPSEFYFLFSFNMFEFDWK